MALQKAYNIKVCNLSGIYQKTINEKQIMGDIRFTSQLDGWQGELVIMVADDIDSTIVAYNNIIKVYESDTTNNGVQIYTGVVTSITRISDGGKDYIEIHAMGLATMLTWITYNLWVSLFNQSFESPSISGYRYANSFTAPEQTDFVWTWGGNTVAGWWGPALLKNGSAFWQPNAPHGTQVIALQDDSYIQQTFIVPIAGTYNLSWLDAYRWWVANSYTVYIDWVSQGVFTPASSIVFNTRNVSFSLSAWSHIIKLLGTLVWDRTSFIDNLLLVNTAWVFTYSKNLEVSIIIKEVVDYFSTVYSNIISYTGTSIESTGITANFTFDYDKCLESIKKVAWVATNTFHVDHTGVAQYHPKTGAIGQVTHNLTAGKDIESIKIEENAEEVVNKYFLTWASGTITAQDVTSQGIYGIRELRETNTAIWDVTTANNFWASYITKNKDAKRKIQITVNTVYNIETIHPGDLVTVRNFEYDITALQIQKIEYNSDRIILELDQITSLAQEIART